MEEEVGLVLVVVADAGVCRRLGPNRGEKGVVVGFLSTLGTPACPDPLVEGMGRALKGLKKGLVVVEHAATRVAESC